LLLGSNRWPWTPAACVLFGAPSSQASGGAFSDGTNSYASYLGPPLTETVNVNQTITLVARAELGELQSGTSLSDTFNISINTGVASLTGTASLTATQPGQPISATVLPFTTTFSQPGTYNIYGDWGASPDFCSPCVAPPGVDFLTVNVAGPAAIFTNRFASPCVNPSGSCAGGSTITQTGNVSAGNLLVGTGGGTGTLTVGPATLTASSVTLGSTSEGDGTVQSGGALSAGSLTVGGTATGSLTMNAGATVGVSGNTIVGDQATGAVTQQGSTTFTSNNLVIGNQTGSVGSVSVDGAGSSLTSTQNIVVGNNGTGSLSVTNGGVVSGANSGGIAVGQNNGSMGTVTITSGGTVNAGGPVDIGVQPGAQGVVTVTGVGSSLITPALNIGGMGPGTAGGAGTLSVTGGGNVLVSLTPGPVFSGGSTFVAQNGTISLSGQGSTLNAGNTLILDPSTQPNSVTIDSASSLIVGSGTGQGLDVKNGGTLQYNLTPNTSASIMANGPISFEAGSVLLAVATSPLTSSVTGQFLSPGNYNLINGTTNSLQALLPLYTYTPVTNPTVINGTSYIPYQLGNGVIYTPLLSHDFIQPPLLTQISTYLIPAVTSAGLQASLDLNQETLTYLSSALPGTGLANPVSLNNENLLATLASDSALNGLTITSAVRTDQQQAQLMINNLINMLSGGNTVPVPGTYADQVYQVI
jgi:T5SS/PEP-CTERM-associated repeat protein